ncbi:hypothetical protein [Prochlorococcus marinus]|uniref:Uncharacterized protein n=1 Tax=Prochlorococcus marinus XMU1408 TaxID=2213228 RepID=A0A318R4X9_PROMR|nr:hypothetical protein [Prochlorococcus marinus]MBW3041513.1 hypothetical protein [Prochlorococcus marinus str. XMU1408]PYE02671.1 hypothetical protein DNJ73_02665 [Prochlorococcus marinus XMU1408]
MQNHPIPSVTDPLQYRAIGIVRGIYKPQDDETFTRGKIIDVKGNEIDSVVLGRVITLIRNHVSLEKPHLWVVYPRCRNNQNLHLQITGIWEPSTLNKDVVVQEELSNESSSFKVDSDELSEGDDYFSIRGELIFTNPEENEAVVKIRQKPRNQQKKVLPFKVNLKGAIPINYLKHFISFDVRRVDYQLLVEDFQIIGPIPKSSTNNKSRKNLKR